jgi:anti-sigma regulatory factor (Ser/Thr protein kinase)
MDRSAGGRRRRSDAGTRATVLGSVTVPGEPAQVSRVRGFVTATLTGAALGGVDPDAPTLLASELVTNAILHTNSGKPGGAVTVVILALPDGVLVEVIDDGSPGIPVVKGDALAGEGQGLYLVQQLATRWGYLRDQAGTTVWFHMATGPPASAPRGPASQQPEGRLPESRPHGARHQAGMHRGEGQHRAAASTPAQIIARSSSLVT